LQRHSRLGWPWLNAPPEDLWSPLKSLSRKESAMMLAWNEYRKQLAAGVKKIGQLSPDTIRGYMEFSSAGQKKNLLGAKTPRSRWL
jgi:hypothetical protein